MKLRRNLVAMLGMALVVLGIGPAVALSAEDGKDPLIGTWTLNLSKSTYVSGTPPKSVTRTFDYTRDGLILVAYETVNAKGERSFTHWYLGLDGKEYPEFNRANGAKPIFYLSAKVVDQYTKDVTDKRVGGGITYIRFQVSPDGKTLTMTYKNEEGKQTNTAVYDKVW